MYVLGGYQNFLSEPIRLVIGVLDATNLSILNIQNVTGNDNSRFPFNMHFDSKNNIRIFLRKDGGNTGPLNYNQFIVDTNLVKLDSLCTFSLCNFGATPIVKDDHSFTFNTGVDPYRYNIPPYNSIHSCVIKVKENGDTIKSTSFLTNNANQLSYYSMFSLFKTKNNTYLASGEEYINGNFSNPLKYIYFNLDSNLNIVSKFEITDFISKHPGGPAGLTSNGVYYMPFTNQDTSITKIKNSGNQYCDIFFLRTIDSTAAIISPTTTPGPTISPEASWEDITVYPNPTDGIVNIGLPIGNTYNLNIYNSLGQSLLNLQSLDANRQVSLANLPEGVYHLVFYETNLKKSITKKVVVRH